MTTLFVSDLHIDESQPEIGEQFVVFLEGEARSADALYILGDLFESWVGDDDPNPHYAQTRRGIRALSASGVPVFFMHGNRDFMIGEQFAAEAGVELLADPVVHDIHGRRVLLSHGDAYCVDDHEYQAVRRMTRDPQWQAMMLSRSLDERLTFAAKARTESMARGSTLDEVISDVNQQAIETAMRKHEVDIMLHGHTHRPAVHRFDIGEQPATRIVLGDWYDQGSVLRWDDNGFSLDQLPR